MEPIVITDKAKITELFRWTLDNAGIINKDVENIITALHTELGEQKWTDEEEYEDVFNKKMVERILKKYDAVVIMPDERVMGRIGKEDTQIFDAADSKIYTDAQWL